MQIAMAHSHLVSFGGGERFVLEVSRRLAVKHHITIYTSHYAPAATYPGLGEFPIVIVPSWKWAMLRLKEDVIFTHTLVANLLSFRNKHVAYCVHSLRGHDYLAGRNRPDLLLRQLVARQAAKRNQRVLPNSKFTATRFQVLYRRAATDVIYSGIDPALFNLPINVGNYALYVGRLALEKGLDRLLAWWQHIDYDLVVVGSGDPAYVGSLKQYNNPRITFVGPKFGAELAQAYQNCRFVVFLPYAEELGLTPLEAMGAGKPVIAANEGGPAETIIHGTTGFLVNSQQEFCQAVTHLIASKQVCQNMGTVGRQHVRCFTWDNLTRHMEQIGQEMVES
jgi:glycosyltransferase involved in cell wall biosynthesis